MVGDHQFNAKLLGVLGFFHCRNAIVHRDDKMIALFRQLFQNRFVQAIAFILAAGQAASNALRAYIAQILIQKGGGGDAIHIIIAKNHDRFAAFHCTVDALHRLIHILEQKRIRHRLALQQRFCLLCIRAAAANHCACQQTADAQCPGKSLCPALIGSIHLPRTILHSVLLLIFSVFYSFGQNCSAIFLAMRTPSTAALTMPPA